MFLGKTKIIYQVADFARLADQHRGLGYADHQFSGAGFALVSDAALRGLELDFEDRHSVPLGWLVG